MDVTRKKNIGIDWQSIKNRAINVDAETSVTLKWVKLKKYCALSGDTSNAVHARRKKGQWLDGIQCRLGPDGNLWINLWEVEKWIENTSPRNLLKLQPA